MPIIYLVQRCFSQRVSFSNLEIIIIVSNCTLIALVTMSFFMKTSVVDMEVYGWVGFGPFWAPAPLEVFAFPLSCYHSSCSWMLLSDQHKNRLTKKQIQSDQEKIDRQKTNTKWPTTIDRRENKYKTTKNKQPDNHWPIRKENNRNKLVKMTKIRHTSSLGWEDPVVFGFVEKEMEVMGHLILNKKMMYLIWTKIYQRSFYHQPVIPF